MHTFQTFMCFSAHEKSDSESLAQLHTPSKDPPIVISVPPAIICSQQNTSATKSKPATLPVALLVVLNEYLDL